MLLAPGQKLGPYEVVSPLGAGGMGEVYRAKDTRLERIVALKILPKEFSCDPVRKQRFEQEAKTISSLNHPHICVLHDIGHQDGIDFLVMECVEGETVAKRLEKGPLPMEQVLKFGAQIADALDKAHRSGVVHRDLKPGNIMLTPTGAKLLDFGLAKPAVALVSGSTLTVAARPSPMTQEGTIVGTFQYMSPEQVEGKELDGRSDIFSLGAVLYEMLTGKKAFEGKSQLSVASAILEREPEAIRAMKPLTPPALDHAIRRCLAKNPEERWQTARDVSLELKWIGESGSQAGTPAIPARSSRVIRELVAWAAVGVLLCALAALGILYAKRTKPVAWVVRSRILPPPDTQFNPINVDAGGPVISPDGKQLVAAVRDNSGKSFLWLRALDEAGEGRALTGTEGGGDPFWSPDSRSIGFFAGGKLKRIDVDANSTQTLCEAGRGRGGTWGPGDVILFAPSLSDPLYQISAKGGPEKRITELDRSHAESSHRWPVFLPDGRHFLYFVRSDQAEFSGIYAGSLDSQEKRQVVATAYGPAQLTSERLLYVRGETLVTQDYDERRLAITGEAIPLPDRVYLNPGTSNALLSASKTGMLVYYPAMQGGGFELAWLDRRGKRGDSIDRGFLYGPSLSPDGIHALIQKVGSDGLTSDLWNLDLVRGTRTRVTSGPGFNNNAAWEPDGRTAFIGSSGKIYRVKTDGGGSVEAVLESSDFIDRPRSVCRDGKHLAYGRASMAEYPRFSIWILPLTGERKPFPLVQSQFSNGNPVFSAECQWVAYSSDESGRVEVYVTHFPDAARRYQISTEGGSFPRWRADGKELFYFSPQQNSLMAVDVQRRDQELSLGRPHALFTLPSLALWGTLFDVAPDGQRFLVTGLNPPTGNVPLTLVSNLDAQLKNK
jgi:Tol biopolymer transport system component